MSKLKTGKAGSSSSSPSVSRVRDAKAFRDYASPSLPTSDASPLMHATCLADAPGTTRPIKLSNPINAPKLPRSGEITLALKDKIGKMLDPVALNVSLPIELELTRTEACRTLLNNGVWPGESLKFLATVVNAPSFKVHVYDGVILSEARFRATMFSLLKVKVQSDETTEFIPSIIRDIRKLNDYALWSHPHESPNVRLVRIAHEYGGLIKPRFLGALMVWHGIASKEDLNRGMMSVYAAQPEFKRAEEAVSVTWRQTPHAHYLFQAKRKTAPPLGSPVQGGENKGGVTSVPILKGVRLSSDGMPERNGVLVPSEELAKNAREKIRKRLVSIWSTSETRDLYEDIPNLLEEDRKFQYVPREVALTLELYLLMFFAPYGFRASISSGQTESTLLELSTNPQFLAKYMHALVTVRDTLFKARGAFVIEENTPTLKKTPILSLRIAKELSSGTPLCQLTDTGDLTPEAAYEQKALVHPGKDLRSGKRKILTEFHNRYHKNHPGTALCPKGLWLQGPANDRSWD
jgi:hypothetical protein